MSMQPRWRATDDSWRDDNGELPISGSVRQGQYLSRTVRPRWENPVSAQEPRGAAASQLDVRPQTATFHAESPTSRVSSHLPDYLPAAGPSRVLGAWDGIVVRVGRDTFKARVVPIGRAGPEQAVEFPIADVSDSDRDLFRKGGIFYWTIAYRTTTHGRVRRISEIRFRRLPSPPRREDDERWVADALQLLGPSGEVDPSST
jgi:hypothetical protein